MENDPFKEIDYWQVKIAKPKFTVEIIEIGPFYNRWEAEDYAKNCEEKHGTKPIEIIPPNNKKGEQIKWKL